MIFGELTEYPIEALPERLGGLVYGRHKVGVGPKDCEVMCYSLSNREFLSEWRGDRSTRAM